MREKAVSPARLRYLYLAIGGLAVLWLGLNAGRLAGLWTRNMAFLSANRAYAVREATGQMDPILTERAITSLQHTAAQGAANDSTWRVMGYLHLSQGEEAQALAAWQHTQISAVELWGNGQKAEADGATEEALTWYLRATEVDPKLYDAWDGAGRIHMNKADWRAAIAVYSAGLEAMPDNSDLLYHLSQAQSRLFNFDDWETLLGQIDRALTTNHYLHDWNRIQTHFLRGEALRGLDRLSEALSEYTFVADAYPNDYWAALRRAEMLWRLGSDATATELYFQRAIAIDAQNKAAHIYLGRFYAEQGRTDEARVQFEQALLIDPQDPTALEWLGQQ